MARPLKILLGIIGTLFALVVIAAGVLIVTFDPNDYRDVIETTVEDATGRQLQMAGDLRLSVFPWLGVETNDVTLANADGFGPEPFVHIGQFGVSVQLMPLLSKQIQIGTVRLDGMRLNLARDEQGKTNWDDLLAQDASDDTTPTEPDAETLPPSTENGFELGSLAVEAVEVSDTAVNWKDAAAGQTIQLKDFRLSTGRIAPAASSPIPLSTAFEVIVAEPATQLSINLVTKLVANLDSNDFALEGLQVDGTASGDAVPAGKQQFSLGTDLSFDQDAGLLKLANLTSQAAGVTLTGQVDGANLTEGEPSFNGRLAASNVNPRSVVKALAIELPDTQDPAVLSKASLDARFAATTTSAELKQLTATLDDTSLTGQASVRDFSKPAIAFDLGVDTFNLDRYLPPANESAPPADSQSDKTPAGDINAIEIPLDALEGLNVNGTFSVGTLQASGLSMTDAKLTVRGKPGQPLEQVLTAKLYGGDVRMDNRVAANSKTPTYRFQGNLDQVLFGELLADLMDKDWLAGKGLFNYDLTTAGRTVGDMRKNLSGTVSFGVADGAIKGIDLARVLTAAEARLRGQTADADAGGQTKFQRFDGAMTVTNGVARIRELKASSNWANVSASGAFNLVDLTLDYTLRPVLSRAPEGAGTLSALVGKTIPVTVTGPVTAPKIGIDVKSLLKAEAQQRLDAGKAELREKVDEEAARLEEKVDKEKERAKEKIRNKLGDFLNRQSSGDNAEQKNAQDKPSDGGAGGG